jgi:hypothetical protein
MFALPSNSGVLTMSNCDGLDSKDLDDLIARLSCCQKAASGDLIPVQDVKEIFQQAGLLEFLLEECPSSSKGASKTIEQQSSIRKSPFTKKFFALAAVIGFSGIVSYNVGVNHEISKANLTDVRKDTSNTGEIRVGDTVGSTRAYPPYFSLIYQGCKRSGTAVKCSVNVTARISGRYYMGECNIRSSHHSTLFDSKGGIYKADIIQFGEGFGDGGDHECSYTRLINDVPVKATLTFKNVDPKIKIIKALDIYIATSGEAGTEWHNPQFREVAIE